MDEYSRAAAYDKFKLYLQDIKLIESVVPHSNEGLHTNDVYYIYD